MGRKRPETNLNQISRILIEEYKPKSVQDIQEVIKDILGDTLESMLKAVYKTPTEEVAISNLDDY